MSGLNMALSHVERYLILDAVEEFRNGLCMSVPLVNLGVSYDERKLRAVIEQLKINIRNNLSKQMCNFRQEKVKVIMDKLEVDLDKVIKPYLEKNEKRKTNLKSVEDFIDGYLTSVGVQLLKDPYIDLKTLHTFLQSAKAEVEVEFVKHWDPANLDFHQKRKIAILEKELSTYQRNIVKNQSEFLDGPVQSEKKLFMEMGKGLAKKTEQLKKDISVVTRETIPKRHLIRQVKEVEKFLADRESFCKKKFRQAHKDLLEELACTKVALCMGDENEKISRRDAIKFCQNLDQRLKKFFEEPNLAAELSNEAETVSINGGGLSEASTQRASQSQTQPVYLELDHCSRKRKSRFDDSNSVSSSDTSKLPRIFSSRSPGTSSATGIGKGDYPLVFRLTTTSIVMARHQGESYKGDRREPPMAAVVGLSNDGVLVCGNDADAAFCRKICSIQDALGGSDPQKVWKQNVTFKLGKKDVTHEITVEFLLGFILKRLKTRAEDAWRRRFWNAAITVPIWFCSSHRNQVKDAAKIAGFHHVRLVNEETVAAHYFALGQNFEDDRSMNKYLLVLSENFGVVSGIIYDFCWSKGNLPKLTMVKNGHCKIDSRGQMDILKMENSVDQLCKKLCEVKSRKSVPKSAGNMREQICPYYAVFVTDSVDWYRTFRRVALQKGYRISSSQSQPAPFNLLGASGLREMTLEQIDELAQEYILKEVFLPGRGKNGTPQFLHPFNKVALPKKYTINLRDLPPDKSKLTFAQASVRDNDGCVHVGELDLTATIEYAKNHVLPMLRSSSSVLLDIVLKVNSEGIASLNDIEYRGDDGCGRVISLKDYDEERWRTLNFWSTMNLTDEKRKEYTVLMLKIWMSKAGGTQDDNYHHSSQSSHHYY